MEALDDIGGVHDPADVLVILEVVGEPRPVPAPRFNDFGIPGSPVSLQLIQASFSLFPGGSLIYSLQILHEGFGVLVGKIFMRVADLMDNAKLNFSLWINRFDGLRKALQIINA